MRFNLFAPVILLSVLGCASKPDVVGKWRVDPSMIGTGSAAGVLANAYDKILAFEFKPDKTFSGMMATGKYTVNGLNVTLVADKPGGAAKNTLTGVLGADGKTLTLHFPDGDPTMFPKGIRLIRAAGS